MESLNLTFDSERTKSNEEMVNEAFMYKTSLVEDKRR
jgi:hypothetical protein